MCQIDPKLLFLEHASQELGEAVPFHLSGALSPDKMVKCGARLAANRLKSINIPDG
jgi:hypothetical protein